MKKLRYFLEAGLLILLFGFFKLIELDAASATGGFLGRLIGPRLGASKKALGNLLQAFPDKSAAELEQILSGMWDNLGRTIAEYPHLKKIQAERIEWINAVPAAAQPPYIFISAHMANWEVIAAGVNYHVHEVIHSIYRAPNNPYVDKLLKNARNGGDLGGLIAKSRRGGRDMIKALKEGESLGLLIDQKYKEGMAVDFFGRPAMTSPAFAELALKYQTPLIPVRAERLQGAFFRVTAYPPMDISGKGVEEIMREAHILLEEWIAQRPAQWLWLHRRWDKRKNG